MALTLGWHIVTACLGVGMPVLLLYAEWRANRDGGEAWRVLARRWAKAFAVVFAVGAVSGTVLSFEMGVLWPELMGVFGAVIGLPFTLEAFAFFLEAIFIGIYLYGWDRLSPRVHWWSGVPIALSGFASAWFVVTANAWMNAPRGFTLEGGVVTDVDPLAAMFNPATGAQTSHMLVAAYMVTGFVVASYYAWARLRGEETPYHRRAMGVAFAVGAVLAPVQGFVGDWAATTVARTQPVKLAAMEGQFETETAAPLRIGGLPNEAERTTRFALEIPSMLSVLAYHDPQAEVKGLNDFPEQDWPPVAVAHLAFQIMVGLGTGLIALAVWGAWALGRRGELPRGRAFLWSVAAAGPASVIALEAGWVVTEVGRQPWIAYGVLRTADAVTQAPGLVWLLLAAVVLYAALTAGLLSVLRLLARKPLPPEALREH
ncbi:MAG: cytochrome ubiquinol oxidase subunit I [Acidobacteria bacterium]|nr:cytochrome ubiquinol oxidase subunit I [Acidobacteriota bacterium]